MKRERAWLWLLLAVLLGACAKTTEPLQDKNTNWLRSCSDDGDCGSELSCLCGLCTRPCGSDAQCGGDVEAVCRPTTSATLAPLCSRSDERTALAVCVASCERERECAALADGLSCQAGACLAGEPSAAPDAGLLPSDAGAVSTGRSRTQDAGGGDAGAPTLVHEPVLEPLPMPDATVPDATVIDREPPRPHPTSDLVAQACADQPGPCTMVSGITRPLAAVVAGDYLYWTSTGTLDALDNYGFDGRVLAMPLAGGPLIVLAENQEFPEALVVHDGYAYWIDQPLFSKPQVEAQIMRVALDRGEPELIAAVRAVEGLAVDDEHAYYFASLDPNSSASTLVRVPNDGTDSWAPLHEEMYSFWGQLLHAQGNLYWKHRGRVFTMPVDGTGGARAISNTLDLNGGNGHLALVDDTLLWAWDGTRGCGIASVGRDGENAAVLVEYDGEFAPAGFAADASDVYWGHYRPTVPGGDESRWVLERSERRTGATTAVLLDDPEHIEHAVVALGATAVYVLATGPSYGGTSDGSIIRIAK